MEARTVAAKRRCPDIFLGRRMEQIGIRVSGKIYRGVAAGGLAADVSPTLKRRATKIKSVPDFRLLRPPRRHSRESGNLP
ncbi:MAG: hypothetical protein LBL94_04365 [Prevotellaceae bacterium]|nr:hypothetical protein [Prevotellaceae bacterium]